jgi:hypothetical protein
MGAAASLPFIDFPLEHYWVGRHFQKVAHALRNQFPERMVKSVSDEDLTKLISATSEEEEDAPGFDAQRIVVVYDAKTNATLRVMQG